MVHFPRQRCRMKKRLLDIAEFRMGYQFRGKVKPDPAGTVRVVQIKDIDPDLRIRVADLVTVTLDRPEPYLVQVGDCLLYTSPSPRDGLLSRMPSSA